MQPNFRRAFECAKFRMLNEYEVVDIAERTHGVKLNHVHQCKAPDRTCARLEPRYSALCEKTGGA